MRSVSLLLGFLLLVSALGARAEDGYFDSNGVTIHYRDRGAGEPVVLLHGFALNLTRWEGAGVPERLEAAGYRAITIDCRGHGESGKPLAPDAYGAEMARDVVRLLDHLGIERTHLLGYSMGGFIANKVRELHPERLRSLILGGSGWFRSGDPALAELSGAEIAESLERTGDFRFMLRAFEAERVPPVSDEEIEARNRRMLEGNDPRALAAVLRGWDAFAVAEKSLRANAVPTLALIGGEDPIKPKTDRLREVMKELEVVEIEGADHGALSHSRFVAEVVSFLERQKAPSPDRS